MSDMRLAWHVVGLSVGLARCRASVEIEIREAEDGLATNYAETA